MMLTATRGARAAAAAAAPAQRRAALAFAAVPRGLGRGRPAVLVRAEERDRLGGDAVVIDYFDDPLIKRSGRMDMLQLKEMGAIRRLVKLGAAYAARLEDMGVYGGRGGGRGGGAAGGR
ncbi:hypothetical protein Rsub_13239, partial [Raphidocelis subcapitata]